MGIPANLLKKINAAYEVLKSHQVSCSANTKSSTANAKSDRTSSPNTQPPISEEAKAYYEKGMDKAKRGRYTEAIDDFSYALFIYSRYAEAYKYRGISYSKLGDNQKAIKDFKKAADLYLKQGNTNDYQDVLERIKKLQPPEPIPRKENQTEYDKIYRLFPDFRSYFCYQESETPYLVTRLRLVTKI